MDKLFVNTQACESEHLLKVVGELPVWLTGALFRLGPGLFDLDEDFCVNHWFDGAAILFRYSFTPGNQVTCRSVYLKTDAYTKMVTVRRPVYTEFGTQAYPDTSKSIFSRFLNRVVPSELTDNVHGNIYTVGKDLYCASETCNIWRINPETLEAECKVDLSKVVSVHLACSHPHIEPDGSLINLGSSFMTGLKYHFYKVFPNSKTPVEANNNSTANTNNGILYNRKRKEDKGKNSFPPTKQIATLSSSWTTMFSYNHSFSVTKKFIILIEQPMLINMLKLVSVVMKQHPLREAFDWVGDQEKTRFRVVEKESGRALPYTFYSPAFFFLHTINAYEVGNHIIIDLVGYDNERVLDTFYLAKLRQPNTNVSLCVPTLRRYVLPIVDIEILKSKNRKRLHDNLTTLNFTSSRSEKIDENGISVTPEYLLSPGFEIPSINKNYDAREYEFVYGSGLFERNEFANSLVKFSVKDKLRRTWVGTKTQFAGEPVFIPRPNGQAEDDGLIISTVSELNPEKDNFLIVLNAINMKEVARIGMNKVPLCPTVHGLWISSPQLDQMITIKSSESTLGESSTSSESLTGDSVSKPN